MENQNQIASRVITVLADALTNFAGESKKPGITPKNMQILFALRPEAEGNNLTPYYRIWENMEPFLREKKIKRGSEVILTDEVSFNEIMKVRIPFLGLDQMTKMYLLDTFSRMQIELVKFFEELKVYQSETQKTNEVFNQFLINNPNCQIHFEEEIGYGYFEDQEDPTSYVPSIEIMIVTPTDKPAQPVALLFYEGMRVRQLDFSKDIFIM